MSRRPLFCFGFVPEFLQSFLKRLRISASDGLERVPVLAVFLFPETSCFDTLDLDITDMVVLDKPFA
jgi:hypothetical protein